MTRQFQLQPAVLGVPYAHHLVIARAHDMVPGTHERGYSLRVCGQDKTRDAKLVPDSDVSVTGSADKAAVSSNRHAKDCTAMPCEEGATGPSRKAPESEVAVNRTTGNGIAVRRQTSNRASVSSQYVQESACVRIPDMDEFVVRAGNDLATMKHHGEDFPCVSFQHATALTSGVVPHPQRVIIRTSHTNITGGSETGQRLGMPNKTRDLAVPNCPITLSLITQSKLAAPAHAGGRLVLWPPVQIQPHPESLILCHKRPLPAGETSTHKAGGIKKLGNEENSIVAQHHPGSELSWHSFHKLLGSLRGHFLS
mmetsp:Transcript_9554/g.21947  ORF Transcript_9554/g.21947 Transcript_9554/m.21947 type:complete len:310 (+) Transcript_9554:490-1419(+)